MSKNEKSVNWEEPSEDRPFYLDIDGTRIYVSEVMYRDFKRPLWSEHKRKEREARCMVSNGRGGLKRCTDDCALCNKDRFGNVLSLDKFYEEYEYEMVDRAPSILDCLIEDEVKNELWSAISELSELDQQITKLFSEGLSERKIDEKVNLSQKTVNKRKQQIFDELRKKLKDTK